MLPWTDRAGRVSALKIGVLVLAFAPALWLAYLALYGQLGPRTYTAALRFTGEWAVRFLILTLLVTPLRHVLRTTRLFLARRLLGLAALGYAALHFGLYVVDLDFDAGRIASEIALRFYLTIGAIALLVFLALGATSFDGAIKRLGTERWRRLHSLVYPGTALGLSHFFIQSRLDVTEPVLMTGVFLLLMGVRGLVARRVALDMIPLMGLALAAALATATIEVAWYALVRNAPTGALIAAQFDFSFTIAPAWGVLAAGLGLAVAGCIAGQWPEARGRAQRA